MTERRLLPHLAAASNELLGGDEEKLPPPGTRAGVAAKAGAGQPTVDRFLQGARVPRSQDLDAMVAAVADEAGCDWLVPWTAAIERAKKARDDLEHLLLPEGAKEPGDRVRVAKQEAERKATELEKELADANRPSRTSGRRSAKSRRGSGKK